MAVSKFDKSIPFSNDTPHVHIGMDEEDAVDVLSQIGAVRDEAEALRDRIGDLGLGWTWMSAEVVCQRLEKAHSWVKNATTHPEL